MKGYVSVKRDPHESKNGIIPGICLTIAFCVPMVSAGIQVPTTKYSFNSPSFGQLKVANVIPYTFVNKAIPDIKPVTDSSGNNWKSTLFADTTQFETSDSITGKSCAPRIWRPGTISYSDIYIAEK
ncbi:MAG TPA: hypothetical protein PLG61_00460 [Methanoregulaceae archaeon]|nr:hypothetical protein [Methanoregulaceae archaeon]MDD5049155.1 hypothetical protein [Methanoregulaceae archaeon]MDD5684306.1 hypothetical protein [Methanoregulaceae archaeon]HOP66172.1 hypothetical protein [Methanoregulaceae archaeon]HQA79724.1 hypothetical protein [Methanoregulaceae archaeon]